MWRRSGTALGLLAVALGSARAQTEEARSARDPHEVQPERPTVATHAGTVAPGWVEIETGVERDRYDGGGLGVSTPTTLKVGLASHVQLGIAAAWQRTPIAGKGVGDLTLGVKWRLLDDAPLVGDLAILPGLKLPTGSPARATGSGTTDGSLLLISSHVIDGVSVDVNAGYTRRGIGGTGSPRAATLWTASFGIPVRGQIGWAAELYGYPGTGGHDSTAPIVAVLAGPTAQPRSWLAFDAGFIWPVAGPQARALYAGAVWNIGRLPR